MPDGLSFDELNKLYEEQHDGKTRSEPYEEYFGAMGISREQKEARIAFAKDFEDFMLLALMMLYYQQELDSMDYSAVEQTITDGYKRVIRERGIKVDEAYMDYHIPVMAAGVINSVMEDPENIFNYTKDRAILISENEANSVFNNEELASAMAAGMTLKTWNAFRDRRTRPTHRRVDGKTISIWEPFSVGEYMMMGPKDDSLGAGMEEIANCRCWLTFS